MAILVVVPLERDLGTSGVGGEVDVASIEVVSSKCSFGDVIGKGTASGVGLGWVVTMGNNVIFNDKVLNHI